LVCIILHKILQVIPDLIEKADMFAGCSNGGMLSMAFAYGINPMLGRAILELTSEKIFYRGQNIVANVLVPKYTSKSLKTVVRAIWKNWRLADTKKKIVLPAFLLDNREEDKTKRSQVPVVFHNFGTDNPMLNELASDLVLRASVAPTYFPSYQGYIDGGIFDLEPSKTALLYAHSPNKGNKNLEDIVLLSIGTGKVQRFQEGTTLKWGIAQWAPRMLDVMWDGMVMRSIETCRDYLGSRYLRIQLPLEKDITLDDPKQIPLLINMGLNINVEEYIAWIIQNLYS